MNLVDSFGGLFIIINSQLIGNLKYQNKTLKQSVTRQIILIITEA